MSTLIKIGLWFTWLSSITSYLTNTNVQLGATYKTSKLSTAGFANGYEAAAKFINAKPEEVSSPTQGM